MATPVVLDFDGSVGDLPGAQILRLRDWEERMRFACTRGDFAELSRTICDRVPATSSAVFMGSGDFHHVSATLISRLATTQTFQVVVLDNHPDNMLFPFGIHCGSWVSQVAALPGVEHVHVMGITSSDVTLGHVWEHNLFPLLRGRLTYWCVGVNTGWASKVGLGPRFRVFASVAQMIDEFGRTFARHPRPTYLSIDKDVLSPDVVRSNWDQGLMTEAELFQACDLFRGTLAGFDITGDMSAYRFRSRWKQWLSKLDKQPAVGDGELTRWQQQQRTLNLRILQSMK